MSNVCFSEGISVERGLDPNSVDTGVKVVEGI